MGLNILLSQQRGTRRCMFIGQIKMLLVKKFHELNILYKRE